MTDTGFKTRPLRVEAVRYQADDILSFEFVDPDGAELPAFTAGAHIDLALPIGEVRSYSLSNDPSERHRYVVGVHRSPSSRGGSVWIHENLRPGAVIDVSDPLNNFELNEAAQSTVLFAGGVGVTPILAMARRLSAIGRPWHLYYAVRERSLAAFTRDLQILADQGAGKVTMHIDAENEGRVLDLARILAETDSGTHVYCCGPTPMLNAFERAAESRAVETVHVEYFTSDVAVDASGGFEVVLEQSGLTLPVPEGRTILETIREAGVDAPFSCMEGICGTCETRVLTGIPEHRDLVLTESEKAANDVMMICCSGSKTPRLVLDI